MIPQHSVFDKLEPRDGFNNNNKTKVACGAGILGVLHFTWKSVKTRSRSVVFVGDNTVSYNYDIVIISSRKLTEY